VDLAGNPEAEAHVEREVRLVAALEVRLFGEALEPIS
jgi:hypothetical protein